MTAFVGEIRLVGFNFAPLDWAFCDGSTLSIADFSTLFQLLGTTYGGDGVTTFKLPDLRGRVPVHQGGGPGLSNYVIGEVGGTESVTLNINELPQHNHGPMLAFAGGTAANAPGVSTLVASGGPALYATAADSTLTTLQDGGGEAHENRQPYAVMNYIICTAGVFPSQS